jgi:DNA-binding GntR family transcriptional regulator
VAEHATDPQSKASLVDLPAGGRLSDLAYQRILEGLFDRTVPAGAFVSQNDLVKLLGVPVAPLRDALRALEAEGVLTIHPRSGIQFIRPDLELTRSTYQFRSIVERAAVRVFAEQADEAAVTHIGKRHEDVIALVEAEGLTPEAMAEIDALESLLHISVIRSLNNPLIESSYKRINNYLRLLRLDRKLTPPLALRTLREHVEIIAACKLRDADKAEAALAAHFNAALQRNLGFF